VFVTVAEVSGDRHAAQLVRALRELDPTIVIEGLGGPEMREAGATIFHETVSNAAMGWRGALRAAEVWKLLRWTKRHFDKSPPDLQIGVDSPSMNYHFAKLARARGVPVLQYVAPQLWAWREGRMEKLRRWVDQVACILPFEEPYFRSHGVKATFVGHPLFDELPPHRQPPPAGERFPNRPPTIGLLPGSRRSVATANLPGLVEVAAHLWNAFPEASFLVPTTAATDEVVTKIIEEISPRVMRASFTVGRDAFDEMVPRCDLCLTVSGTATLHVAGYNVPMIVVYHGNPVLWHGIGRWLVRIPTRTLVNLLAAGPSATPDRHVTPEFTPWYGSVLPVADLALDYLRLPEKLEAQRQRLAELVGSLDRPGASANVARIALDMIGTAGPGRATEAPVSAKATAKATAKAARRAVMTGLLLVPLFGLIVLAPLLLRRGSINRFIVAFGLAGMLLSGSFLLHGSWDWLAARRRR
jgi:lipid-A-disaccharide synthase